MLKKYIAEILGTFALVFCGTGAIVINQETHGSIGHLGIAISFGLVVMAMIYSLGHISGAHLNPAVTLAFALAKKHSSAQVLPYVLSQFLGAMLASGLLHYLFPGQSMLGNTLPAGSAQQSLILEGILTFFLMLVILNVATGSQEKGLFAGLAIGGTVLLEALFAGPICGASMNPVRSISPALATGYMQHLWLYLVGPIVGAALAVPVWQYLNKK
jgi:aquaporin NIP